MLSRTFPPLESDASPVSIAKRIAVECEQREVSPEKLRALTDKLFQLWTRSPVPSTRHREGYRIVEYLEQALSEKTMSERFLMLMVDMLGKNESFYQTLLNDHKRFQPLFSSNVRRSSDLMRYMELLYRHCPPNLIATSGVKFYRFCTETYCLRYLRQNPRDFDWLAMFSALIDRFHENSSKSSPPNEWVFLNQKDATDYCTYAIDTLAHRQLNPNDSERNLTFSEIIAKVVGLVWEWSPSGEQTAADNDDQPKPVQERSIEYLFEILSHPNSIRTTLSPAVCTVFPRIPLGAIDSIIKNMFSDGRLSGERLTMLVRSLIRLIDAPSEFARLLPFETWIVGLCLTLISYHHHDCVLAIIDESTPVLLDHLLRPHTEDIAGQLLFWYVRYDKRVETFRRVLDRLPALFERLKTAPNEELKSKLIDLCHMGVALHPDCDVSNEPILKQIIHELPQPDLNVLLNHRTAHARLHSITMENDVKVKSRVGIVNLGNTCYVNSVLQALYQCLSFRQYLLEESFREQPVLKELQLVFAQLNLSKRPCINAIDLVKVARPAWFTVNEQQDCAEFLGYLLDTIKDEEKLLSFDAVHRLFTIRTCQINRCQRCSHESIREESSNYLFLPIPTLGKSHDTANYNQSAAPVSVMRNGLKFYAAANGNSSSADRSRSPTASSSLELQSVFDSYFQKEELKDENQYRCEQCRSLQNAERLIVLRTAPEYLILSLNRFEYDKHTNVFRKVFTRMNYPRILSVHVSPPSAPRSTAKYSLVLIIVHTGYTLHGGHYYVYARDMRSDDEWFLFNDDIVTASSYEAIMDNCAQYSSATPYVVFYQRVDSRRTEATIRVRESLVQQVQEDNSNYERESER